LPIGLVVGPHVVVRHGLALSGLRMAIALPAVCPDTPCDMLWSCQAADQSAKPSRA